MTESVKKRMFLIYHGRFPGEKAAALFAAKSAESFASAGLDVTLLVPRRLGRSKIPPTRYFGIKENFKIEYLPTLDLFKIPILKRLAFILSLLVFSKFVFFYLILNAKKMDLIFSNETLPLLFASLRFPSTFFEVHDFPKKSYLNRWLFSRLKLAIATNHWKKRELARIFQVSEEKIFYEPNAVDVDEFMNVWTGDIQRKLDLAPHSVLVGYVGALKTMEAEKGVDNLLKAVKFLPAQYRAVIVGGNKDEIRHYRQIAESLGISERITFTGWVRHSDVPKFLIACDCLVAPFPNTPHYDLFMSPMKLFEYMAAGKPIVATKLQSIQELVSDDSAVLVEPDDPEALAKGIMTAIDDKIGTERRVRKASELVREHTWSKRAERIISAISK